MKLFTEDEMCEFLAIGRVTLYNFRQRGMPYIPVGSKIIRYNVSEVLEWFKEQKEKNGGESILNE